MEIKNLIPILLRARAEVDKGFQYICYSYALSLYFRYTVLLSFPSFVIRFNSVAFFKSLEAVAVDISLKVFMCIYQKLMLSFDAIKDRKTFQFGKVVVNFVKRKIFLLHAKGLTSSNFISRGSGEKILLLHAKGWTSSNFISRGSEGINNLKG